MGNDAISYNFILPLYTGLPRASPYPALKLLLQTKKVTVVWSVLKPQSWNLISLLCSLRKAISSWNKVLLHVARPKGFYWNENSTLIQPDRSLQYPRKYSPKQQQRARAARTKPSVTFMAARDTPPVQPACSLCGRGRLQGGAGIYSTPRYQVVPPH